MHACDRFDQYVFGREITVETDHNYLGVILKKPLLAAPKRLQRIAKIQFESWNETRVSNVHRRYHKQSLSECPQPS